jgi:SAM-dependent methyltransferase
MDIADVPVYCNVLFRSSDEALKAPRGDISLQFCNACGHVYNAAFDSSAMQYDVDYDNSLHFSDRFQAYAQALAKRLVDSYQLKNKDIVEIGCGKGDFLLAICDLGQNRGYGFDRSFDPAKIRDGVSAGNVTFYQDFYDHDYSDLPVDFVCCRHVLEHIQEPTAFLKGLRSLLVGKNETTLYFEVPNALFTLESLGIWDLIYEHCSYFTERSLVRSFEEAGFDVLATGTPFGDQYLYIEARASEETSVRPFPVQQSMAELKALAAAFEQSYRSTVDAWTAKLASLPNGRSVVWGGGSKGVTFLNVLRSVAGIECLVDVNPNKQGRFVPVTGQEVVSPARLSQHRPTNVIVMNEIYLDEINQAVKSMGLDAVVEAV